MISDNSIRMLVLGVAGYDKTGRNMRGIDDLPFFDIHWIA
jgi:hypothetical protein